MLKTSGLTKIYRNAEVETRALQDVSLEVKEGEFVAIMGPSGCGKTTLLNILGLLDNPSMGTYEFLGEETSKFKEKKRAKLRKNNLGYIFQNFNLIDELNVFENVELPLIYMGLKPKERKKRTLSTLEKMHILHRKHHFPQQLSGGQQQRVAVARAVVGYPKLILADEPTGNLDSVHGEDVMRTLNDLNKEGTTIIMVTHSQRDASYANRIIRLFDGQIINENILQSFTTKTI
ncbi:MAG: ABC transporter ATP-binding protein [Bacteroidales bacterium]|nr:ABC transporter ATP-binding protein [Bacteroidales bacterium]RLD38398.1 MAG: ABC transporter ATP-binding protein [Bacteroidota bacterium]